MLQVALMQLEATTRICSPFSTPMSLKMQFFVEDYALGHSFHHLGRNLWGLSAGIGMQGLQSGGPG